MPSTVIPPGYSLLVHRFLLASDPEEMVFTMGVDNGALVDPDIIAGNAVTAFLDNWTPDFWVNESRFVGVTAYVGQDGPGSEVGEYIIDEQGTATGAVLPSNCAMLVRKRTGTAGRRGRGRCYFPGVFLLETAVDSRGALTDAYREFRQDAADAWLADLGTTFGGAVVLHTNATAPTPITALQVDGVIATQRKRLRP